MKPLGSTDPVAVGSYRLLGVLGGGGMGRVYLGESRSGRRVAIKVIRSELAEDPNFRRRFAREVAAIRTVNPLFTAAVVEADTVAAAPWVATTYIDGPTLGELVTESGPMAGGAVLTLAAGLADALTSIHRAGLVHRDIKPSNVIINDLGPHVIDFGIALTVDSTNLTTSVLLGTPSYIAPEIIQGGDPSRASDVFSLGSTLVFAASGRHLVSDGTMHAQILRMTMGRFDLAAVPKELRPLLVRCLSPRPRDRPTADELARIVIASGVAAPAPHWYARPDAAPPVVVPPLPVTLAGETTVSRRSLLVTGVIGAAALGTGVGIAAALIKKPTYQSALRRVMPTVSPTPTPPPVVRVPGVVLWEARSGVDPVAATTGSQANGARVIVMGTNLVAANAGEVFAVDDTGRPQWRQPLPTGLVTMRQWGEAILATDSRSAWILSAGGVLQHTIAVADLEVPLAKAEGQSQAPEILSVAVDGDKAYFGLGTAIVAYHPSGDPAWRQPRAGQLAVGRPIAANGTWVLTHDVIAPSVSTTAGSRVRVGLRSAADGRRQWPHDYTPAPFQGPAGGPPGGAQPVGGPPQGAPPDGPGPGYDDAWAMVESAIGNGHVVIRDAQEVRWLSLATGAQERLYSSPTPVTALELAGDTVLIAADKVSTFVLATGQPRYEIPVRGARMVATPDGRTVVIATEQFVTAVDVATTETRWRTTLPTSIADAAFDQVSLSQHEVYLKVKARGDRDRPLDIDVVAFALD